MASLPAVLWDDVSASTLQQKITDTMLVSNQMKEREKRLISLFLTKRCQFLLRGYKTQHLKALRKHSRLSFLLYKKKKKLPGDRDLHWRHHIIPTQKKKKKTNLHQTMTQDRNKVLTKNINTKNRDSKKTKNELD